MKRSIVIALIGLGLFTYSCTNDFEGFSSDADNGVQGEAVVTRSVTNVLKFTYHGKVYETERVVTGDSCFYTNLDFNNVVNNLKTSGNDFVTFLHANGMVELFDNQSDFDLNKERLMEEHNKEKKVIFMQDRGRGLFPEDNKPYLAPADPENNEVEIHMYEDQYYWGDWTLLTRTKHDKDYVQVAKEWNYGGNPTSMIVHSIGVGGWFTFFERMGCQGKSFSMIVDLDARISLYPTTYSNGDWGEVKSHDPKYGALYAIDLREVQIVGISGNWNDRIHSIRVERYIGGGGIM